jgi:hypothetical protein
MPLQRVGKYMHPTLIGKFRAVGSSGKVYTIEHWQRWLANGDPGLAFVQLANGRSVTQIAKGEYRIDQTGEELISNDPDAP